MMRSVPRRPAWRGVVPVGLVLAGLYVLATALSFGGGLLPAYPLFDGTAPPPPYQWVKPPPDRVADNKPPSPGSATVALPITGAPSVSTPDGQAQLLFETTSVPAAPGQASVSATLVPSDATITAPPPAGMSYYSNAYTITGAYQPSGSPLQMLSITVALTDSSATADKILHWNGSSWDALATTPVPASLLLYAPSTSLGVFVAAGPSGGAPPKSTSSTTLVLLVIVPFAVIGLALAVLFTPLRKVVGLGRGRNRPGR